MGDRASLFVTVYACPRQQTAAIVEALEVLNLEGGPRHPERGLFLGEHDGEVEITVPARLAEFLAEHATGATFTVPDGSYCPTPAQVHHQPRVPVRVSGRGCRGAREYPG